MNTDNKDAKYAPRFKAGLAEVDDFGNFRMRLWGENYLVFQAAGDGYAVSLNGTLGTAKTFVQKDGSHLVKWNMDGFVTLDFRPTKNPKWFSITCSQNYKAFQKDLAYQAQKYAGETKSTAEQQLFGESSFGPTPPDDQEPIPF